MGDAWVAGLLFCFFVQDRGGLELLGVVPIVEIDRAVQRKRVKNCRFAILRVVLVQKLHCLLIKPRAGLVVDLVVILVEDLDRGEVFGFAWRVGLCRVALLDCLPPGFEVGGREGRHQRVGQLAHRQAPIGHGAAGVLLNYGLKRLDCLGIEEIVQERDASIELGLHRAARDREVDGPEMIVRRLLGLR